MFWLWVFVILEALVIVSLISKVNLLDREAHRRLVDLENSIDHLLDQLSDKADKPRY